MTSPLADALSLQQPIIPASKANIAPTDVLGAYQMATNQANQQYLAKLQQQNSLWGGLAGLGGSALTASILKGNLFGPAASTAATNAAGSAATAPLATGAASSVPLASNALDSTMLGYGADAAGLGTDVAAAGAPLDLAALGGAGTDAAATGLADAGTVAGADAAADAAAGVGAAGAADAGGMTLADLLPFLFAA